LTPEPLVPSASSQAGAVAASVKVAEPVDGAPDEPETAKAPAICTRA
jgi:hypothetical protein